MSGPGDRNPAGVGRTSLLTPELADKIVLAVRTGVPLEVAAQTAGIHKSTFWEWMRRGELGLRRGGEPDPDRERFAEFAERVRVAEAEVHTLLVGTVRTAATQQGSWQAAQAYLRMRWSNHYAERIEHTGAEGGPISLEIAQALEALTEDEVAAIEGLLAGTRAGPAAADPSGEGTPEEG